MGDMGRGRRKGGGKREGGKIGMERERYVARVSMDIEILNVEMSSAERTVKELITLHLCACLNTCLSACAAGWLHAYKSFQRSARVNRKYSKVNSDLND